MPALDPAHPSPRKPSARRPPRAGLVGPLFKWELVRLARRGQDARARFILATVLLVVLSLFTLVWFRDRPTSEVFFGTANVLDIQSSARFAEQFSLTFVMAQLAVLVLLTPAYAAGGISEEKERKTFPFLLVSDLRDREIVFGKLLGRLVFLLGVMMAGLPILALTLLYGGVSVKFLMMSYLLTGTTVTLLSSIAVVAAVYAETFRGALFRGYGISVLHVGAGCGLHPLLSPFGILLMLFGIEAESFEAFLAIGFAYAAGQLFAACIAVYYAIRGVRQMRATLTQRPKPGPRPQRSERKSASPPPEEQPLFLDDAMADMLPTATLPTATRLTTQEPVAPQSRPDRDRERDEEREDNSEPPRRRRKRKRLPKAIANRPPVDPHDPFLWKERHVIGSKRDEDDESIQGLQVALGAVVALTVGFFAFIAVCAMLLSGFSRSYIAAAEGMLMIGGSVGLFAHLLMIGSAACGTVCRERQRLTLESLLTIPVERWRILWPKWRVCASRGWWWGGAATGSIGLALLVSDTPLTAFPGLAYLLFCAPLAASYGLWLSIQCHTMTRAVLWFMPVAGGLVLLPILIWSLAGVGDDLLAGGLMMMAAGGTGLAAWAFWSSAGQAFEREGRG